MPDIQHAIPIAAKAETIYPLVATGRGFAQWWAADVTENGPVVELGFFNRATLYRLRLADGKSPVAAEWLCETGDEWNGTHIRFRLEPGKSGIALRFTHAGWHAETDYFLNCNTTWGELMYRLKAAAEGKAPGPLFSRDGLAY
jgi:hypothetical protein